MPAWSTEFGPQVSTDVAAFIAEATIDVAPFGQLSVTLVNTGAHDVTANVFAANRADRADEFAINASLNVGAGTVSASFYPVSFRYWRINIVSAVMATPGTISGAYYLSLGES